MSLIPFVLYFAIGLRLESEALRHLRDPKPHGFSPLLEPELFTDAGQEARLKALRFWWWGGVALVLYVVVF